MAVINSLLDLVGQTSLIRLRKLPEASSATVFAKMEQQNPGGSVKDRICLAMITDAEKQGILTKDSVIVEPTSGNTGIGLALVCAAKGYKLVLTMPESMSLERRALLKAYGAELILTPDHEQMDGAIRKAKEIAKERRGWIPSQFDNPANPAIHQATTAQEIISVLEATQQVPDAFVAAVGTGGTVSGVGRALKSKYPGVSIIAVEPETCATISRGERGPTKIQGIAAGFVPENYDRNAIDDVRTVTDGDAWETKQKLAREEGLLVGISAGANVAVALKVAKELGKDKVVITVLCDTGERYFSLDKYFPSKSPSVS